MEQIEFNMNALSSQKRLELAQKEAETTALVSNGVRITVKNNDNDGSTNPWGYMMLAGG